MGDLDADYLVVGAGAMGLAFVDELVSRDKHAQIVLVDRRAAPGGHWNDAYPFVTLHQPAAFYGVNSEKLGAGGGDLASWSEILAYFKRVVDKLVATGRVVFLPQHDHRGEGEVVSLVSPGVVRRVRVRRKIVDASYSMVRVPSTTPPRYEVADGVELVPINALATLTAPRERYVIIGAGKTGIDAALYLMDRGVEPARITWIVSNDAWFFDRANIQVGVVDEDGVHQLSCALEATDLDDLMRRLEARGRLLRLDQGVWPTRYRCATVTQAELRDLRRIESVVRMGRVSRIEPGRLHLRDGELEVAGDALFVDCTADGLARRPVRPVFEEGRITLQPTFMCQQVFSAALIAFVEHRYGRDEARKNAMCRVAPHPEVPEDYLSGMIVTLQNMNDWGREFIWWLRRSRLCFSHHTPLWSFVLNSFKMNRMLLPAIDKMIRLKTEASSSS